MRQLFVARIRMLYVSGCIAVGGRVIHLIVESVSKTYRGNVQALRNFGLTLGPGVLGLLGPNGAGKSTLMRILATITRPTSGGVLWNDADIAHQPDALRGVLGYLPQDFGIYPNLSALEFLGYLAAVKGIRAATARKRISALLELVNLSDAARRPLGGYSGGMRQRVGSSSSFRALGFCRDGFLRLGLQALCSRCC